MHYKEYGNCYPATVTIFRVQDYESYIYIHMYVYAFSFTLFYLSLSFTFYKLYHTMTARCNFYKTKQYKSVFLLFYTDYNDDWIHQ